MNRETAAAPAYACSISSDVTAVHFAVDDQVAQDFQQQWRQWANDVPLLLVPQGAGNPLLGRLVMGLITIHDRLHPQ